MKNHQYLILLKLWEAIKMRSNNFFKTITLILLSLAAMAIISLEKLSAQQYDSGTEVHYKSAVAFYNNGDYVNAIQSFGFVLGAIYAKYNFQTPPVNVMNKITEIQIAENYCRKELQIAIAIRRKMEKFPDNFDIVYSIESGGKMDGPSQYRTVQEHISLYQEYIPKPNISENIY